MSKLSAWAGVARAPFLLLPVTLVAAGVAAAAYDDRAFVLPSMLAMVGLVALHAAVNAFNEASDMLSGIDLRTVRTPFSGGSGTLPSGALSVGGSARRGRRRLGGRADDRRSTSWCGSVGGRCRW